MGLEKLLVGKALVDGPTPIFDSAARLSTRSLVPSRGYSSYNLFVNTPQWRKVNGMQSLLDWFGFNPVLYATVMIKAREYGNMRIQVVDRRTGDIEPENTLKVIPKKLYALFNKPNVLQSRWEFFMQRKIFEEVCGNSFTYGNFSLGFKPGINNITSLWNVWPSQMNYKLGGNYFEATQLEDIISKWKFEAGRYKKEWEPNEVMHRNKPNTNLGDGDGLIFGKSPAESLIRPLSNIDMAYESRNVIMRNRGMRVILTSAKSDTSGNIPLLDTEKDIVHDDMKKYGLLEGQEQFWFTSMPLNAVPIDQDVMKLGLFEEIQSDTMVVGNAYGVPNALISLTIRGLTFENQEASVRRLYQGTLIPEAEDEINSFNNFLALDETDWMLRPSFSHVPVLQESENQKVDTLGKKSGLLLKELDKGLITPEMYWQRMGYGPMPQEIKNQLLARQTLARQIQNPKPEDE